LLAGDAVRAAFREARRHPKIRRVQVSTNGLALDDGWLRFFAEDGKAVLVLSLDGTAEDHRRLRRALPGVLDSHDHLRALLPRLFALPRVAATQVIAPATAARGFQNFLAVLEFGFSRVNLLPGYYLPWSDKQLADLSLAMDQIGDHILRLWAEARPFYLRNLGTRGATPFYNTGLVVDCDGSIHPSNLGMSGRLEGTRVETALGSLHDPPSPEALQAHAVRIPALLEAAVPGPVWRSTLAVDALLTALVRRLSPHWLRRVRGRAA
jgi:hypothetical protein